jgi:hypothetical protein
MAVRLPKDELRTIERSVELKAVSPGDTAKSMGSPARDLQRLLAARTATGVALDEPEQIDRWSRRTRLIVLVATTTTLWSLILWGVGAATGLIA